MAETAKPDRPPIQAARSVAQAARDLRRLEALRAAIGWRRQLAMFKRSAGTFGVALLLLAKVTFLKSMAAKVVVAGLAALVVAFPTLLAAVLIVLFVLACILSLFAFFLGEGGDSPTSMPTLDMFQTGRQRLQRLDQLIDQRRYQADRG